MRARRSSNKLFLEPASQGGGDLHFESGTTEWIIGVEEKC